MIIAGAGQVGFNIARYLAGSGYGVTMIDQRAELVQKIGDSLDIRAIVGHAAHPEVQVQAGVADTDMLIAVTHYDEVNMIACQVAHTLFEVPLKIARVRQPAYLESRWQELYARTHLPIDVLISPELEVARAIALRLELPGATTMIPFADDALRLVGLRVSGSCPIVDTPLRQLTYLFPDLHLTVVGIARGERFFIPDADDALLAADEVFFVVETGHLARALPVFGVGAERGQRIIIVGGGNIGLSLAKGIEARDAAVAIKLIELDPVRAGVVADQLRRVIVLQGDVRDRQLLEEAGIRAADSIITVTNSDEINILSSLLAKNMGCRQALALVNNSTYNPILRETGVDVVINPRDTTVSSILRHVRRGRIRSVQTIRDGEAEVFEAEALETSPLIGKPLRELRLPSGVIVGALLRQKAVLTPRAETVIKAHDRVVILAKAESVRKVEQLFAVRLDYF